MKKFIVLCALSVFVAGVANANEPAKKDTHGEFGNHCAMGLTMGKQVATDCSTNWTDSKSGKTYCFSSEAMKADWAKNAASNETKASSEFSKLSKGTMDKHM